MDTKDISGFNADMKTATAVRDKEHADFLVEEKEQQESVEQVGKTMNTVEVEPHDTAQTACFQQMTKMLSMDAHSKKLIQSDLAPDQDELLVENLAISSPLQLKPAEFKS